MLVKALSLPSVARTVGLKEFTLPQASSVVLWNVARDDASPPPFFHAPTEGFYGPSVAYDRRVVGLFVAGFGERSWLASSPLWQSPLSWMCNDNSQ